jgi:hypothetical protein
MIEYFTRRLGGVRNEIGLSDVKAFGEKQEMAFRRGYWCSVKGRLAT